MLNPDVGTANFIALVSLSLERTSRVKEQLVIVSSRVMDYHLKVVCNMVKVDPLAQHVMALSKFVVNMVYETDLNLVYFKDQHEDMLEGEKDKTLIHQ